MKIYFVGAQSTGKSTLSQIIAKQLNLPVIDEIARAILVEKQLNIENLRTDLNLVDEFQSDICFRQIEEEKKHESFVSDRGFDNLAYMAQHARLLSQTLKDPVVIEYLEGLKKKNVIIFFVRPSLATLKNDGVREQINWDNIISIDGMIKLLLELFDLNYIQINTDSMQERVKLVKSVINLL